MARVALARVAEARAALARAAEFRAASKSVREDPRSVVPFLHRARMGRDRRVSSIVISLNRPSAISCSTTQRGRIAGTRVAKTVDLMAVADSSSTKGA